jgi:hypothetical protein
MKKHPMNVISSIFKWIARIASILAIGIIFFGDEILRFSSEYININYDFDFSEVYTSKGLLFLYFPYGVVIGMIISWWYEGVGGSVTLLSLIALYIVGYIYNAEFPSGLTYYILSSPGFLFILYSILTFNTRHRNTY